MTTVEEFVLCARQLEVRADIASRFKRRSAMQAGLQHHGQFSPTDFGHVRSHSEFGCEFLDKGRNPLTVDFKLRGSLDLMLVLGSGCSQQAFAFGVAGCPQKSSVQQCQSAPKFAIHVGPKT